MQCDAALRSAAWRVNVSCNCHSSAMQHDAVSRDAMLCDAARRSETQLKVIARCCFESRQRVDRAALGHCQERASSASKQEKTHFKHGLGELGGEARPHMHLLQQEEPAAGAHRHQQNQQKQHCSTRWSIASPAAPCSAVLAGADVGLQVQVRFSRSARLGFSCSVSHIQQQRKHVLRLTPRHCGRRSRSWTPQRVCTR